MTGTGWARRRGGPWRDNGTMKSLLGCIVVLVGSTQVTGNVGVFGGSGATIELIKSDQVQLVSEEVTISPTCGAARELDRVEYRCKFVLKNRANESVQVQVGFPLDREVHGGTTPSTTDLVMSYHFIARDAENTYHVRYVNGGRETSSYKELFLWNMTFASRETRVLHVGYILPMSIVGSSTRKDKKDLLNPRYEKPWHAMLEGCFLEHFRYITETGRSWAEPIEKATFRVETGGLEWCLNRRPIIVGAEVMATVVEKPVLPPGTKYPTVIYRQISPGGWKCESEHRDTVWEYHNFRPGPPLNFFYYHLTFPDDAAACESWVRLVLGAEPKKVDVSELREIAGAFYGIAPHTDSAKKFVEKQIWYHPKNGLRESELDDNRQAVLKRLDVIAKNGK
jgi:hypothetical protein